MSGTVRPAHPFPIGRWIALAWLAVWIPVYWRVWGWQNFLHLCDVAVILSCAGFWFGNQLLISSQAVAALLPDCLWCLDAGWHVFTGHGLINGTEYLWDPNYALWVRLLSLYHVVLPCVLIPACLRMGYDRRALALQSGIAAVVVVLSRLLDPAGNMNYAFLGPIFHKAAGPPAMHVTLTIAFIVVILYWPTHALLRHISSRRLTERR